MSADADLLILGGGIAGLTTALAAAERQLSVIVIDSPRPGAASRAAAGMLAPSAEKVPSELRAASIAARDFYPTFLDALHDSTGIRVPLDRNGILELAPEGESDPLRANAPEDSRWLDRDALRELEPALEGHPGALLHPVDGAVDNVALMDALERAVERVPTIRRVAAEILSVDSDQPSALTRTRGRFFSTRLVLATGAWAAGIPGLPRPIPVRPVRG